MSLFALRSDEYKRDLDFHRGYKESLALYVSIMKGVDVNHALERVNELSTSGGALAPEIPHMTMNYRPRARTDRVTRRAPMDKVINEIEKNGLILGPNLVVYENPGVFRAYQGDYIDHNLDARYKIKKEGQIAKQKGDIELAEYNGQAQVNKKTLNNSMSGAHSSEHNPNYCASAHTTLTSTCRIGTSSSNSNAERFIMGNRHYYNAEITLENLLASIRLTDPNKIKTAIEKYDLVYPDVDWTIKKVKGCTELYWRSVDKWGKIEAFIRKLTPIQRAAVAYSSDLASFIDLNPEFTRQMFDDLTLLNRNDIKPISVDETQEYLKSADSYIMSYISTLSAKDLAGKVLDDFINKESEDYNPEMYGMFGARLKAVTDAIKTKYMPLIRAFFVTDLMPHSIYAVPVSVRKCVIGSDTDSTLYTTQSVVEWYMSGLKFNYEADCCRELVTYLNSQLVVHILAKASTHLGVSKKDLFRMTMKPEFSMPVMAFTNRMKHYIATISACEGNVYEEPELEVKGVALKSSKVPRWVIEIFFKWCEHLIEVFQSGNKITPQEAIAVVAYLEHTFINDLKDGKTSFLSNYRIKDPAAYKAEVPPPLVYKDLWDQIFGPKYGKMSTPPVDCKKVSVDLTNKTKMLEWLEVIDPEVSQRFKNWLPNLKQPTRTMLIVPQEYLEHNPLPDEIWQAVDKAKLLVTLTESFYYILECLGIYFKNDSLTRFAFNEMSLEEAESLLPFDVKAMMD